MRLRGRGAAGWQQDQTHRGQSSLKRPGWGVGAAGPQVSRDTLGGRVLVYVTVVYVDVWSKAHACLELMHIIMWVGVSDSICHMDSHTLSLDGEGRGVGTSHLSSTLQQCRSLTTILQICESTQCDGEYKGCLPRQRSANHLGSWTEKFINH